MVAELSYEELHGIFGEPFKLEIGTMTMDGYTGDTVWYSNDNLKDRVFIRVGRGWNNDIEVEINIMSVYSKKAKKRTALADKVRALGGLTEVSVNDQRDSYSVTFTINAVTHSELEKAAALTHMVIEAAA